MGDKEKNFADTNNDKKFLGAISTLRNEYDNQSHLEKEFFPVVGKNTINRYWKWSDSKKIYLDHTDVPKTKKAGTYEVIGGFTEKTRKLALWLVNPLDWPATYSIIGRIIGVKREAFPDELKGDFNYYRFFPKDGGDLNTDHDYVSGKIKIEKTGDNVVRVKHWSHNHDSTRPEHNGYCYYSGNRLIMILFREGVVRLVTANCHGMNMNEPLNALVQTVLKTSPNPIFAAQVALIKSIKGNKDLIAEFDPSKDKEGKKFQQHIKAHGSSAKGVLIVR